MFTSVSLTTVALKFGAKCLFNTSTISSASFLF